mgnify:CR=1 FL=1
MGNLNGKVALVTGSGRGIRRSVALKLASEGAAVVVNDIFAECHRTLLLCIFSLSLFCCFGYLE